MIHSLRIKGNVLSLSPIPPPPYRCLPRPPRPHSSLSVGGCFVPSWPPYFILSRPGPSCVILCHPVLFYLFVITVLILFYFSLSFCFSSGSEKKWRGWYFFNCYLFIYFSFIFFFYLFFSYLLLSFVYFCLLFLFSAPFGRDVHLLCSLFNPVGALPWSCCGEIIEWLCYTLNWICFMQPVIFVKRCCFESFFYMNDFLFRIH